METIDIVKEATPEEMKSPEFLDMLTDKFMETLKHDATQVYSKEGHLPEDVLTAAFDHMQKRSMEGRFARYASQSIRIFAFHMGENVVKHIEDETFYRIFSGRLVDFIQQVPEYANAEHIKPLLEKLEGDDFSQVYGEGGHHFEGDELVSMKPLFVNYHNFAANLREFLEANFKNPFYFGSKYSYKDIPSLVPVFNFQWPEALVGEEAEKAVDALKSYSCKRRYRYDRAKQDIVLDEHGELTPYEIEMADKNGKVFGFVSRQLIAAGHMTQIVAAPLYSLNAVPMNMDGESWIKGSFANDVMRDEFGYHGFHKI